MVLNAPVSDLNLLAVVKAVDIPVVITVIDAQTDIGARLEAAEKTPSLVKEIRRDFPNVPIIATGGNKPDTIEETIAAGANAITYTPPSIQVLFKKMMAEYRET